MIVKQRNNQPSRYTILKPNSTIYQMKRLLAKPHPRCGYELAMKDNISVRKYKKNVDSIDTSLQEYQWRFQQKYSIVRALYVELLTPNPSSKSISFDVYIEDIEVTLSKMKKLLLPQAIYLMVRTLQGYKIIWQRYKRITVDEQAIGLNSLGICLVWINSSFDKNYTDQYWLQKPKEIVREVIELIRTKCQKICAGILLQLVQNLSGKDYGFVRSIEIIMSFVQLYKIKIPNNLKYIINQERLIKNCQNFKAKLNIKESNLKKSKENPINSKCFNEGINSRLSRTSLASQQMRSPRVLSKQDEKQRIFTTFRKTLSPNGYYKTFGSKLEQTYNNQSLDSKRRKNQQNSIQNKRFYESTVVHEEPIKKYHSRCKSQSFQWGKFINNIRPKKREVDFMGSKQSENIKTAQSMANNSKWSFNSQNSIDTAKKQLLSPSHTIKQTPTQPIQTLYRCKQFQSYQCSPFIIQEQQTIKRNHSQQIQDDSSMKINTPQTNEVFLANKWTATVKNLLSSKMHLNKSITQGHDTQIRYDYEQENGSQLTATSGEVKRGGNQ